MVTRVKWHNMYHILHNMYHIDDCCLQADFFYSHLNFISGKWAPLEEHVIRDNDRPWVSVYFKQLIKQRDLAYLSHNMILYKKLRNKVNVIRKSLQKLFYLDKVECLKSDNPSKWWRYIKAVCKFNGKCSRIIVFKI